MPTPYSPASKAFLPVVASGRVAVGHDHLARARRGRGSGAAARRRRRRPGCSTSPSRGVKPTRSCQFCQRSTWPSSVEARALGLGDLERARCRRASRRRPPRSRSCRRRWRWGRRVVVEDVDHLARVEVDRRAEALDRRRVGVRQRVRLEVRRGPDDPAPGRVLGEAPGAERVDLDDREVLDAAAAQRLHEARVGERRLGRALEVLVDDRRQHAVEHPPGLQAARPEVHDPLVGAPGRAVGHDDACAPRDLVAGPEGDDDVLRRVDEHDEREHRPLEVAGRTHDADGRDDLLGRQRVQRMGDCDDDAHASCPSRPRAA